jgi:hypothetical protein
MKVNYKVKLLFLVIIIGAMSCQKRVLTSENNQEINYDTQLRPVYLVDTITIDRAIGVFFGGDKSYTTLYLSEDDLDILKTGNLEKIANHPKLYFSGNLYFGYGLPRNYVEHISKCRDVERELINDKITIFRHTKKPVSKFLIALVNINHYNKTESFLEFRPLITAINNSGYIKVAFPLCDLDNSTSEDTD